MRFDRQNGVEMRVGIIGETALWDVVTEDDGVYLLRKSGAVIVIR